MALILYGAEQVSIVDVDDSSFESQVLNSSVPVLVDYWAEWCQPCKMIAPVLEEVAPEYQGQVQIAKLNIDDSSKVPAQYGVRGIPTLMLFVDGEVKATKSGFVNKSQLSAFLDQHI